MAIQSHPSRVRELKQAGNAQGSVSPAPSHPSRVRELKQDLGLQPIMSHEVAPLPGA